MSHASSLPVAPSESTELVAAEADYDALTEALMQTRRGRWFLAEHARRCRESEHSEVRQALARIEERFAAPPLAPAEFAEMQDQLGALARIEQMLSAPPEPAAFDELREKFALIERIAEMLRERQEPQALAAMKEQLGALTRIEDALAAQQQQSAAIAQMQEKLDALPRIEQTLTDYRDPPGMAELREKFGMIERIERTLAEPREPARLAEMHDRLGALDRIEAALAHDPAAPALAAIHDKLDALARIEDAVAGAREAGDLTALHDGIAALPRIEQALAAPQEPPGIAALRADVAAFAQTLSEVRTDITARREPEVEAAERAQAREGEMLRLLHEQRQRLDALADIWAQATARPAAPSEAVAPSGGSDAAGQAIAPAPLTDRDTTAAPSGDAAAAEAAAVAAVAAAEALIAHDEERDAEAAAPLTFASSETNHAEGAAEAPPDPPTEDAESAHAAGVDAALPAAPPSPVEAETSTVALLSQTAVFDLAGPAMESDRASDGAGPAMPEELDTAADLVFVQQADDAAAAGERDAPAPPVDEAPEAAARDPIIGIFDTDDAPQPATESPPSLAAAALSGPTDPILQIFADTPPDDAALSVVMVEEDDTNAIDAARLDEARLPAWLFGPASTDATPTLAFDPPVESPTPADATIDAAADFDDDPDAIFDAAADTAAFAAAPQFVAELTAATSLSGMEEARQLEALGLLMPAKSGRAENDMLSPDEPTDLPSDVPDLATLLHTVSTDLALMMPSPAAAEETPAGLPPDAASTLQPAAEGAAEAIAGTAAATPHILPDSAAAAEHDLSAPPADREAELLAAIAALRRALVREHAGNPTPGAAAGEPTHDPAALTVLDDLPANVFLAGQPPGGKANPLAALYALSEEERIALFS